MIESEYEDEEATLTVQTIDWLFEEASKHRLKPIIVDGKACFTVHHVDASRATFHLDGYPAVAVDVGKVEPGTVITVNVEASKTPTPIFFSALSLSADEADFVSGPTWTPMQQAAMRAMNIMREPDALSTMPINRIREMAQPEADDRLDRGARRESRRSGRAEGVGKRPVRRHASLLPGYDK